MVKKLSEMHGWVTDMDRSRQRRIGGSRANIDDVLAEVGIERTRRAGPECTTCGTYNPLMKMMDERHRPYSKCRNCGTEYDY